MKNKTKILKILESYLGPSISSTGSEQLFDCPVCKKKGRWRPGKKKLSVNIKSQAWKCWVCQDRREKTKGLKFRTLLRKLTNASSSDIQKIQKLAGDNDYLAYKKKQKREVPDISLPDEYYPLWKSTYDPIRKHALNYLKNSRGLTVCDICKHRIGYCGSGKYKNRIIIPSYNEKGDLNYFVARKIPVVGFGPKYLNPKGSKNIIGFDWHINWNLPVTLVEGVFDAITAKRNAIPLLGKKIPDKLYAKIITIGVQEIYLCLDGDAISEMASHAEKLLDEGIDVYVIRLQDKDVSEIGFNQFTKIKKNTNKLSFKDLVKLKMF